MPYEAKREVASYSNQSVINRTHPPVVITKEGFDPTVPFEAGSIIVATDTGYDVMPPYDPAAATQPVCVGVATRDFDPSVGDAVEILVHGTVNLEMLKGDANQIALLTSQLPIYAI